MITPAPGEPTDTPAPTRTSRPSFTATPEASWESAEVIVHEFWHLKVPNHGKLFKALLRSYLAEK